MWTWVEPVFNQLVLKYSQKIIAVASLALMASALKLVTVTTCLSKWALAVAVGTIVKEHGNALFVL